MNIVYFQQSVLKLLKNQLIFVLLRKLLQQKITYHTEYIAISVIMKIQLWFRNKGSSYSFIIKPKSFERSIACRGETTSPIKSSALIPID